MLPGPPSNPVQATLTATTTVAYAWSPTRVNWGPATATSASKCQGGGGRVRNVSQCNSTLRQPYLDTYECVPL